MKKRKKIKKKALSQCQRPRVKVASSPLDGDAKKKEEEEEEEEEEEKGLMYTKLQAQEDNHIHMSQFHNTHLVLENPNHC